MRYIIVTELKYSKMVSEVNRLLDLGYECVGGLSVVTEHGNNITNYYQAMIKPPPATITTN